MYQRHPSTELNQLFAQRPFQGAAPESAQLVFVGLDANYAEDIAAQPVFSALLDYHRDGTAFWQRHGVHHPFLLPAYRGDGRRYHANFARIGLSPAHAARVSFVELLHVPTVGRNRLDASDLDARHLAWIDSLVAAGARRHVFVSSGVLRLMLASRRFPWLRSAPPSSDGLLLIHQMGDTRVYRHLHFSNYGKFQAQMDREAAAIRELAGQQP